MWLKSEKNTDIAAAKPRLNPPGQGFCQGDYCMGIRCFDGSKSLN